MAAVCVDVYVCVEGLMACLIGGRARCFCCWSQANYYGRRAMLGMAYSQHTIVGSTTINSTNRTHFSRESAGWLLGGLAIELYAVLLSD